MKFDTPITAAAKRMTMLLETGYLSSDIAKDIKILMQGAMAYEMVSAKNWISPKARQQPTVSD